MAKVTHFHIYKCGDEASGRNTVSGIALITKTQNFFRVARILWKTWHPSPARLCRPSPLTQGDFKQALTFPLLLQQNKFQVPKPKPDKKLLAELRRLPPLSEAEGSQFQEIIYNQLIPKKIKGEDYEPCNFFAKNFQTVCPNAWIEKWNEQREKVNITFDFLRL